MGMYYQWACPKPRGGSSGGLRGLEHPPRSKFRFQRELTGVINSFSSAKTHCREPTARAPITHARSITTTPTMSMSMRIAKERGYDFVFLTMSLSGADLEAPPSPRLPPFAEKFMSSLSPTFILSVHARFSMSDSFVDLPQEVVN